MLTAEQQLAISGGSASTALQAQLQAVADRNRQGQQLYAPPMSANIATPGTSNMPGLDGLMWLFLGLM